MSRKGKTYSQRGFAGASMRSAGGRYRGKSYAKPPYEKPEAPSKFGEPKRKFEFGSWEVEHR